MVKVYKKTQTPAPKAVITAFHCQPFSRRAAVFPGDEVMGLRFSYHPAAIKLLKALLTVFHHEVVDHSLMRESAGGWLPQEKMWWVEISVWPSVKKMIELAGFTVKEVR